MKTLYDDYIEFEKIASNFDGEFIDLDEKLLRPTILTPLVNYSKSNGIELKINNSIFNERLINEEKSDIFLELPYLEEDRKGEIVKQLALSINFEEFCGMQTIIYIFNELVSNVLDHSSLKESSPSKCYIHAKEYCDLLDIFIMDNGSSIPGNFERHGIEFIDDCDAISKAVNQISTQKNSHDSIRYSRGFGLWSSLKLVIEGNLGKALIVSRNGCLDVMDKIIINIIILITQIYLRAHWFL
ncbi:MAG: hypothetical protein E7Z75_00020 [Methanobrevibacter olleyae]|uniref:Uncharacterized protein n=1 Tax=Methanobrevibacter olleyae TaxID=294671 RepID=A0A8T3VJ15_METOL|nr:hypothetical protein [Methanobrevibacter olleyae]